MDFRPNDAAIMELGLIYSDANSIPPGIYLEVNFEASKWEF